MYLIRNTDHLETVNKIVEELRTAQGDVCLKASDGEEFHVAKVLLSIFCPFLVDILDRDGGGSDTPVISVPIKIRTLQLVFQLKIGGSVTIGHRDLNRIKKAFNILGINKVNLLLCHSQLG